jgi:hypothetical protein
MAAGQLWSRRSPFLKNDVPSLGTAGQGKGSALMLCCDRSCHSFWNGAQTEKRINAGS